MERAGGEGARRRGLRLERRREADKEDNSGWQERRRAEVDASEKRGRGVEEEQGEEKVPPVVQNNTKRPVIEGDLQNSP